MVPSLDEQTLRQSLGPAVALVQVQVCAKAKIRSVQSAVCENTKSTGVRVLVTVSLEVEGVKVSVQEVEL